MKNSPLLVLLGILLAQSVWSEGELKLLSGEKTLDNKMNIQWQRRAPVIDRKILDANGWIIERIKVTPGFAIFARSDISDPEAKGILGIRGGYHFDLDDLDLTQNFATLPADDNHKFYNLQEFYRSQDFPNLVEPRYDFDAGSFEVRDEIFGETFVKQVEKGNELQWTPLLLTSGLVSTLMTDVRLTVFDRSKRDYFVHEIKGFSTKHDTIASSLYLSGVVMGSDFIVYDSSLAEIENDGSPFVTHKIIVPDNSPDVNAVMYADAFLVAALVRARRFIVYDSEAREIFSELISPKTDDVQSVFVSGDIATAQVGNVLVIYDHQTQLIKSFDVSVDHVLGFTYVSNTVSFTTKGNVIYQYDRKSGDFRAVQYD